MTVTVPGVSTIITTYNRAGLLPRAIESAKKAASDSEVIVVDDCSTDETPDVCARIEGIRYVRLTRNQGLANARNVGIAESASEFIAFLDDDDLRLPGSIDKQLAALKANESAAFCYGQALMGDARRQLPTGELYPHTCPQGDIFWELLDHNFVPMPSVLARKSCLIARNGFNTELTLVEDWDMWLRLSEDFGVVAVTEPVAIYRKSSAISAQMCSNSVELCRHALRVQQMALSRARARAATRAQCRSSRRSFEDRAYRILMTEAARSIHEGDKRSARAPLRDAFRLRPLRTLASGRLPWLFL